MRRRVPPRRLQALGGAGILAVVLVVAGPGAVAAALRSLDAAVLATGLAIACVSTAGAAWRWRVVARGLGIRLSAPAALAGCYRAQFLNMTLPGGVLGDLGRGVRHGRAVADVTGGLRAVAWERTCGQLVLVGATLVALVATGWPAAGWPAPPWWTPVAAAALGVGVALAAAWPATGWPRRVARMVGQDARVLAVPRTAVPVLLASLVVLTGHVATFALAAHAVRVPLDASRLVPISLVVLLVGALPLNVAGWGPREGAAAWAFAASGLDASRGVAVPVAYGTLALTASAPGAALLLVGRGGGSPAGARAREGVRGG